MTSRPLTIIVLLAPSLARAEDAPVLEDYVIQPGDTCVKIARERFGEAKRIDIIHKYNKLGEEPHHLRPGQVIKLPPPASSGPDAELTFLRNKVDTFTPERRKAALNDRLSRGNKVATEERSAAEVTFTNSSRLELGENTLIVILGHDRAEKLPGVLPETNLVTGALRASLGALAGETAPATAKVRTDAAEVALGHGESKLSVDAVKTTRLAVYRGRSSVRAAKKTVEVPEGYGSGVKKGEAPSPPRPLPAAPLWAAAPPPTVEAPAPALVQARYQAGADGATPATFHVQLARDERFGDLLVDTRVAAQVTALEARELGAGVYFARVSAIDADEFEGPFGPVARTEVTIVAPPPPPVVVAPPPPPPKPPLRLRPGAGVLAGSGWVPTNQRWGPRLALEVAGGVEVRPRWIVSLALRGQWERLDGAATDDPFLSVTRRALGVGLLASLHHRLQRVRGLTPYAGVLGEVNFVSLRYSTGEEPTDWFTSWGPVLGAALPLGPGALSIEGSWRAPTSWRGRPPRNGPISALGLLAGYRMWF